MTGLDDARYVSLTTFKRDGSPVATPVWITGRRGSYVFTTGDKAWKTRRIRKNPSVEVQVCNARGRAKPQSIVYKGTAEVRTTPEDIGAAERALSAKYGWQFKATKVADAIKSKLGRGADQGVVAIHLSIGEA